MDHQAKLNEFAYFDENPKEDPFKPSMSELEIIERLISTIHEFLEVSTARQLIKIVADQL